MRLLIIRHGESEADIRNVCEGRADFSLTQRGHKQAEAMSKYVISHYDVTRLYSSTLLRAHQTAQHLADLAECEIIEEPMLMEFDNGLIADLDKQKAMRIYPIVPNVAVHDSVYEQESRLEFRFRADYILSKICSELNPDDTAVIITHGGMINQLYHAFLRLAVDSAYIFRTRDTGIHEWQILNYRRIVIKANQLSHIDGI